MKKVALIIYILFAFSTTYATNAEKLTLHFFGESTCGQCFQLKSEILYPLLEKHRDSLDIVFHNTDDSTGLKEFYAMNKAYNVEDDRPQELFFPDTLLKGFEEIDRSAKKLIEHYLGDRNLWESKNTDSSTLTELPSYKDVLEKESADFSFWLITAAGLADGVNPCAIATMIFLVSFLATQKRKKQEIFIIGQSYITAVFVTYLLMGISAFEALTSLKEYHLISSIIRWATVALATYVAYFSFYDAYTYNKTGKNKDIKLQLPKSVKMKIHKVISGNLSKGSLITGAIVTGFLVTLLEAVCTGQMYLPIIQGMTESEGTRLRGWLWLIYYNVLFVLPLQIVMIAAYKGTTWEKLAKKTQKNMVALKFLLGVVMTALATYLASHALGMHWF